MNCLVITVMGMDIVSLLINRHNHQTGGTPNDRHLRRQVVITNQQLMRSVQTDRAVY